MPFSYATPTPGTNHHFPTESLVLDIIKDTSHVAGKNCVLVHPHCGSLHSLITNYMGGVVAVGTYYHSVYVEVLAFHLV